MFGEIFDVFEEHAPLCDKRKFILSSDKECTWIKIYVFTKEDIDLVEELNKLNSVLVKHELYKYGEFSICLDHLLLPDKAFAFLSKKKTKKGIKISTATFNFLLIFGEQLMKMGA